MASEKLDYRTLQLAAELFAGSTGFTHGEMADFFRHALNKHQSEIGEVPGANREEKFKAWLNKFSVAEQKRLLLQLCRHPILSRYYDVPSEEDRLRLAAMLGDSPIELELDPQNLDDNLVHESWRKALERRHTDPEGAITAARTLLESVCKHILDERGVDYADQDNLPKLYGAAARELNLAPSQHTEDAFKKILGGAEAIVNGLANIRNKLGDAHGQGKRPVRPKPRHAELAVNMAGSVAAFLLATFDGNNVPGGG